MADTRQLLIRVLDTARHYESHSASGPAIMRGLRYDLAVRATDLNGDGCRFPACECHSADCARGRASMPADDESSKWDNRRIGER